MTKPNLNINYGQMLLQKVLEGKFKPMKTQTSKLTLHTRKPQRKGTHKHYHHQKTKTKQNRNKQSLVINIS